MAQARLQENDDAMQPAVPVTPPGARQEMPALSDATIDESSAPASVEDDRQSVEEGAVASAGAASVLHTDLTGETPHSLRVTSRPFSAESTTLTTEELAQQMSPEEQAFWDNSPKDMPQLLGNQQIGQAILDLIPPAERTRWVTWCEMNKVDPLDAFIAALQQDIYRPEAMQRTKAILFSGSGMKASQSMPRVSVTGSMGSSVNASGPICGYCNKPIEKARDGQLYHSGECGALASGRQPMGKSYYVDPQEERKRQQEQRRLEQFAQQENFTVPPQQQLDLTPLAMPTGFCGLCTRAIDGVRQGQRFHDGACVGLATGRMVPGQESFVLQVQRWRNEYHQRVAR